jgi:4-amino-4-deoxy-L-arabinose transferase-like glycosyltransferase
MKLNFFKNPETNKFDLFWTISVAVLAAYSGFAYLYQLAAGQRSEFYASVAVSMSKSLSNWWWGASDPGGSITLDKIPGSFWIPAIFVKAFGFSTWSVNAANALAAIATVIIVAATARTLAGRGAGVIAGAIVATTPILAAVARSNQPETYFLLCLAIAANFAVKALKRNSFKHLMLAGVFVALAFQCYMLVAWAAWPAIGVAWLLTNQLWVRKIWTLAVAGLSSLALSLVWIISVSLTPASARPFIGGSNTNSAWEMVFGYNGLGRFSTLTTGTSISSTVRSFTPPFSGEPSVVRLLNDNLLPQIGWLVPAALVAIIVITAHRNVKPEGWFVIGFFAIYAVMFSVVAGMHQFYTAELGIGIALLVSYAIGLSQGTAHKVGLIAIVAVTAITSLFIAVQYSSYFFWAPIVQLALAVAAVLVALLAAASAASRANRVVLPALLAAALTFAPAMWAADVYNSPSSINPVAGPTNSMGGFGGLPGGGLPGMGQGSGFGGFGGNSTGTGSTKALITYLKANGHGAKYVLAVFGTMTAAPYITATGENVLPIGGFNGSDPSPTLKKFKALVATGQLRFVQVSGGGLGGGFGGAPMGGSSGGSGSGSGSTTSADSVGSANSTAIQSWVTKTCQISSYKATTLYECTPSVAK